MKIFARTKTVKSTPFSDFIRDAKSAEKKRVYAEVLENAGEIPDLEAVKAILKTLN